MTDQEILTQFEGLIKDEDYDPTLLFQILSYGKNHLERKLKMLIHRDVDETQTASPGNTYLTLKSLPTGFRQMLRLVVGTTPYYPVSFLKREMYRNSARKYYINYKRFAAGSTALGLCGAIASAQTIYQYFLVKTTDLTEATATAGNTTLTWPTEFHPILAFYAAKVHQANLDPDDINFRLSSRQEVEMQAGLDAMINWDHDLKLSEQGNAIQYGDEYIDGDLEVDIGSM